MPSFRVPGKLVLWTFRFIWYIFITTGKQHLTEFQVFSGWVKSFFKFAALGDFVAVRQVLQFTAFGVGGEMMPNPIMSRQCICDIHMWGSTSQRKDRPQPEERKVNKLNSYWTEPLTVLVCFSSDNKLSMASCNFPSCSRKKSRNLTLVTPTYSDNRQMLTSVFGLPG